MKSTMILKKLQTTPQNGTFSLLEKRTFFGSKMMEIEDNVTIDDNTIQYSQTSNGFQYFDFDTMGVGIENIFTVNLNELKRTNHSFLLMNQGKLDRENNTNWQFTVSSKEILRQYLFSKIKDARSFRCFEPANFFYQDINKGILEYIDINLINRYKIEKINFYVKYSNIIDNQTTYGTNTILQYNPQYDITLRNPSYLVNNLKITSDVNKIENLVFQYNQVKSSKSFKYDYYFDLFFVRI